MSLKEYPTSGAELPALDEFQHLAMDLIEPSLTNPRKHFDATKLAELAESIKASGVHQPVLVRPLPGSRVEDTAWIPHRAQVRPVRPTYELVCGERRLRATKIDAVPWSQWRDLERAGAGTALAVSVDRADRRVEGRLQGGGMIYLLLLACFILPATWCWILDKVDPWGDDE